MSTSASLFRQLNAIREASDVPFFRAQKILDPDAAASGGSVPVSRLCSYARAVGAEIRVVVPGKDPAEALKVVQAKLDDVSELAETLDTALLAAARQIKSLESQVLRLQQKAPPAAPLKTKKLKKLKKS